MRDIRYFLSLIDEYSSYLKGKIEFSNSGFPIFDKSMFLDEIPENVITYPNRNSIYVKNLSKTVICFYAPDRLLYPRLDKVIENLDEYKKFLGVVGMDLTVTKDMDMEWQKAIMLLNQLHMAILACNGIKIVANLRNGSDETVECLSGIPRNVMCATGFLGCTKDKCIYDFRFISKILSVCPSMLIIYGKHDPLAEDYLSKMGVRYRVYKDFHRISKRGR